MDRQHRHDLKHDKFVDEIGALSARARDNQRLLTLIAIGVLAVALAAYGIYFYRSSRERKAQVLLSNGIDTVAAPIQDAAQPNQTGPWFRTEAERNTAAEKHFREVKEKYSRTDAADVASLFLARMAASRGDSAGARRMLEDFIDEHEGTMLVGAARYSLYQLRIDTGEATQVAAEVNAELSKAEPVLPGDALLMLLAHAYEVQGNVAKSKDAYRRISTEFPDSAYAIEATRRAG